MLALHCLLCFSFAPFLTSLRFASFRPSMARVKRTARPIDGLILAELIPGFGVPEAIVSDYAKQPCTSGSPVRSSGVSDNAERRDVNEVNTAAGGLAARDGRVSGSDEENVDIKDVGEGPGVERISVDLGEVMVAQLLADLPVPMKTPKIIPNPRRYLIPVPSPLNSRPRRSKRQTLSSRANSLLGTDFPRGKSVLLPQRR